MRKTDATLRLENSYIPEPMSGCWLWERCAVHGYGKFKLNGEMIGAHRAAYMLLKGPIPEPKERVREASRDEEAAFMDQLDRGYDAAVAFALLTGCRRMEIVGLTWQRVDFFNRQFTVIGKGGKSRSIPMSNAVFSLLWDEKDHDPVHVFTYVARRTRKVVHAQKQTGIIRGVRYPMTDAGLRTAMRRALSNAKVEDFRFHDLRHTAATRILRGSNLRVVQNLLGHSDPATTARYAHALADDIRAAMDAASPTRLPTDELEHRLNSLKRKGKSS